MKINEIIKILETQYPVANCTLNFGSPFQLLIATILSAQCTDKRVNMVAPSLFEKFGTVEKMANAKLEDVSKIIYSLGFYSSKSKNIIACAQKLRDDFNSVLPNNMEDLLKLPGVGRKTANLVLGDIFGKPSVVTDTHAIRISNRLGLTVSKNPAIVEKDLQKIIPPEKSSEFCHRLVAFGRDICKAQNPNCPICPLKRFCKEYKN